MGSPKGLASSRKKTLANWFPAIAEAAHSIIARPRSAARLETAEILMDLEQVTTLFSSLEEWRGGQIVSMDTAFGDL